MMMRSTMKYSTLSVLFIPMLDKHHLFSCVLRVIFDILANDYTDRLMGILSTIRAQVILWWSFSINQKTGHFWAVVPSLEVKITARIRQVTVGSDIHGKY